MRRDDYTFRRNYKWMSSEHRNFSSIDAIELKTYNNNSNDNKAKQKRETLKC